MDGEFLIVVLGGGIFCSLLGLVIGASRGRAGAGFLCGFLLGPLGVIIALFLPKEENTEGRKPGSPTKRKRVMPTTIDPLEAWEAKERAKTVLEVPEHLRGHLEDDGR